MIDRLLSPEVQKFIKDHLFDDPFLLSLNTKKGDNFPLKEAIEQIQAFQKARKKLPSWISRDDILWPPPLSVEQSSSELTAGFKSELVKGKSIVDLTGGMGVDTISFANRIEEVCYVEADRNLCEIAKHNFKVLGQEKIEIHNQNSENFLNDDKRHFDVIFIDPSRRAKKHKVFKIVDCTPNLYDIIPLCRKVSDNTLVKLSPLIDLSLLIREFQPADIWVVAVKNEVKEVLFMISNVNRPTIVHAIDLDSGGERSALTFNQEEELNATSEYSFPLKYLYEPNAAILKTGAFKLIGQRYGIFKLHRHSHLYTSDNIIKTFPGRILKVNDVLKPNKKELIERFPNGKANVVSRNYPLSTSQLKKMYSLKDGGNKFLIATTLHDGSKILLSCERLDKLSAEQ